ncbi:MAG TPA: hypothetical protein VIC26_03915 [Marinagarivorans sp.]
MKPDPKVLTIEDSLTFATMLKGCVTQQYGFGLDIAASLTDARGLVMANPQQYLVAIVALHPPNANGLWQMTPADYRLEAHKGETFLKCTTKARSRFVVRLVYTPP